MFLCLQKAAILTTVGVLEEPLGNVRLHSARLVAALLHTGTPSVNQELCRLNTMGLLLVSGPAGASQERGRPAAPGQAHLSVGSHRAALKAEAVGKRASPFSFLPQNVIALQPKQPEEPLLVLPQGPPWNWASRTACPRGNPWALL